MSTTRRLNVEVVGSASSFIATMNRVTSGVTRFGSGLGQLNRNAQASSRFIQAMGTTLRYAFAGRVIFGIQNAINNLGEFKSQLGEVDALAGKLHNGKLQGLGPQLDEVGKSALLMSNRFGIAVGDVETYMQRFFSSFNPQGTAKQRVAQMNTYTEAVLNLASAIGSEAGDPQKLASGLTGLINALPGGRAQPGRGAATVANYFAAVLRQTPGLTGADIATAAGRFASAKSLANMSVPDILSVFGVAAQTGGSPAVIIRGITQLLGQSLLHPTRPQSLRTYQAAGLPTDPNMLAKLGGTRVLERLINYVAPGGLNLTRAQRARLATANRGQMTGIVGGQINLDAIYNAFSRQESVRQFVNLIANGGVPAIQNFNKSLKQANKEGLVAQMASTRLRQSLLLRMRNAGANTGLALVAGADWPLENLIARPFLYGSNALIRHPNVATGIVSGALALGAANALRRLGAFGRFGRGRLGGLLGAAQGAETAAIGSAISKEELPAALSGGATDGTRANPFWVIISPLSWSIGSPGGAFAPGPTPTPGGGGTPFGWFSKLPKSKLFRGGAVVAGALITDELLRHFFPGYKSLENRDPIGHWLGGTNGRFDRLAALKHNQPLLNALEASGMLAKYAKGDIRVFFEGNPKADLTIKLVDSHGRTLSIQEHKGVPIVPKAKQFPTSQGKAGSRKATPAT